MSAPAIASAHGPSVCVRTTTRVDGDFAIDGDPSTLAAARRAVVDLPWVWLRQVHGRVVHVVEPGREAELRGADGDALVAAHPGVALAVQTADCVPIVLVGSGGAFGVVHAGWRGLEAGVIEAAVQAMTALDPGPIEARIGPCIGVECYEFGADDLERMVGRFGAEVVGTTRAGGRGLDTTVAARLALESSGVRVTIDAPPGPAAAPWRCTACNESSWYSHRARGDRGRMATVVWRER